MAVVEAFDPNEIRLTDNAVTKVRALVEDEGNPDLKLRVYITGGGCSGFQYGFSFDEAVSEDDMIIERDGVTALIDVMSYQYLVGSEVDYSEGLEGSRFVVNNPNATTTCGCGARTTTWAASATDANFTIFKNLAPLNPFSAVLRKFVFGSYVFRLDEIADCW